MKKIEQILLHYKTELCIVLFSVISILVDFLSNGKINYVKCFSRFYDYIDASTKNLDLVAFIAISIGIYVSIIMIISTSRMPASKEILKHNLDKKIIEYVFFATAVDVIVIIYILFVPAFEYYKVIYLTLVVLHLAILIKFLIFVLLLCKVNVEEMVKEIDAEKIEQEKFYNILCDIQNIITKINSNHSS